MDTPLLRAAGSTLVEQLVQEMTQRIHSGALAAGSRLPSVRAAAQRFGVSPHTVVAAYDQLSARGLVEAQRHRGFFVRTQSEQRGKRALQHTVPHEAGSLVQAMFPAGLNMERGYLTHHITQQMQKFSPASGTLPMDWLDQGMLTKALRRAVVQDAEACGMVYGSAHGDKLLREMLSVYVQDFGIVAEPQQIVTTAGATHALDIVAHTLLQPGDCVLVDAPGWSVEFARLSRLGVRPLPVPRSAEGVDLAVLEHLAATYKPKAYTTVSVLHNPTGHSISLAQAHQVLQLAEKYDFYVVEDDTYAFFAPVHSPRYAALDGLQRTFYITGFSKIWAPGWRVGCVMAPAKWVHHVLDNKLIAGLNTATPTERAMALCLQQGWLRRYTEGVVSRLDAARQRVVQLARKQGLRFAAPPAGLFGWLDLGVDSTVVAQRLLDEDWLLVPGHLFYPDKRTSTCVRINFAAAQDAGFWKAVGRCV